MLWVLAGNARARRFYQRCGWSPDGVDQIVPIAGVDLGEVRYAIDLDQRRRSGS